MATVFVVGLHAIFNRFVVEFFEKQKIKKQFAGYASPNSSTNVTRKSSINKKRRYEERSFNLFLRSRGFTPLGESFGDDVKGLTKIMNGYMDAITQPIQIAMEWLSNILAMQVCMSQCTQLMMQNIQSAVPKMRIEYVKSSGEVPRKN